MSRNFTPEQILLDRLLASDTAAFEELTRRYCFSLYTYCMSKLNSKEDSKRIVRNIFIALWEDRLVLPANFSLPVHLYTEVRKAVVQCINHKLNSVGDTTAFEQEIIPGFRAAELKKAKSPIKNGHRIQAAPKASPSPARSCEQPWWERYTPSVNLRNLKQALTSMVNF